MTSWFLFSSLFVFLFMGIPISICLGLAGMFSLYFFGSESLASLSLKLFETSEHYTLMAIPKFAAGILCNAGTLGILIPPSIVMVVYCAVTEQSVGRIFLAGILPGLLLSIMMMISIYIYARIKGLPSLPKASFKEVLVSAKEAIPGFFLLIIIMGGIYGGIFTPTEAAAVAAVYAVLVSLFIYKDITFKDLPRVFVDSSKTTVMVMFIIANAILFAHVLTIIMVVNMEIGMVTPPVGLNLFVTSGITGMSIVEVLKGALPWMTILIVFLGIITYFPKISTTLPDYLMGKQSPVVLKQR
ncbi:MAG: TRAP transporter large permease subunit [Candidatus Fonsibacter ubiquis]|nr:TRAP transporter large permease subunit [Candidatus Fonsibacter ubiquis]